MDRLNFNFILKILIAIASLVLVLYATIFILALLPIEISTEELDKWLSVLGGMGGGLVALVAVIAILKGDKRTRDEGQEKVLEKIAEWAIEVKNCSLTEAHFPPKMTKEDFKNLSTEREHNKLMRYLRLKNKGTYLVLLAKNMKIKEDIISKLVESVNALDYLLFVLNIEFGVDLSEEAFLELSDAAKQYISQLKSLKKEQTDEFKKEFDRVARQSATANMALMGLVGKSVSGLYS